MLTKTIGFRVSANEYVQWLPFVETFGSRTFSEAFRWLLEQPEVEWLAAQRVKACAVPVAETNGRRR